MEIAMIIIAPSATQASGSEHPRSLIDSRRRGLIVPPPRLNPLGALRTRISRKGRAGRAVTCGSASRTIADRRGVATARGTLLALIWAVEMKLSYIVLS
jgi:hypothetical protein